MLNNTVYSKSSFAPKIAANKGQTILYKNKNFYTEREIHITLYLNA